MATEVKGNAKPTVGDLDTGPLETQIANTKKIFAQVAELNNAYAQHTAPAKVAKDKSASVNP